MSTCLRIVWRPNYYYYYQTELSYLNKQRSDRLALPNFQDCDAVLEAPNLLLEKSIFVLLIRLKQLNLS